MYLLIICCEFQSWNLELVLEVGRGKHVLCHPFRTGNSGRQIVDVTWIFKLLLLLSVWAFYHWRLVTFLFKKMFRSLYVHLVLFLGYLKIEFWIVSTCNNYLYFSKTFWEGHNFCWGFRGTVFHQVSVCGWKDSSATPGMRPGYYYLSCNVQFGLWSLGPLLILWFTQFKVSDNCAVLAQERKPEQNCLCCPAALLNKPL